MSKTSGDFIGSIFKRAFNAFSDRFGSWLLAWVLDVLVAVGAVVALVLTGVSFLPKPPFTFESLQQVAFTGYLALAVFILFLFWLFSGLMLGGIAFVLAYLDRREIRFELLFSQFKKAFTGMLAAALYSLVSVATVAIVGLASFAVSLAITTGFLAMSIVALGAVPLFVVGAYFLIRFAFFYFFIADKNAGSVGSLRKSWRATRGYGLSIFIVMLVVMLVSSFLQLLVRYYACSFGRGIVSFGFMFIMAAIMQIFSMLTLAALYRKIVPAHENKQELGKNPKPYVR